VRLLLDTCTFLWWIAGEESVPPGARALIANPANEAYLSAVSSWEIAVKHALGRLPLPDAPQQFVPRERIRHGLASLALDEASTLHLHRLPDLHRDPFDRMLVCQAIEHGMTLVTPDSLVTQYPVRSAW
jgi:PIN domain nuclease of toxin-antitoxin system